MCATWVYLLNHFKGMNTKKAHSFRSLYVLFLDVYMFMYFVVYGLCDEVPLVDIPLGFELSGSNKTTTWVSQNGVFEFGFLDGYLSGIRDDNDNGNGDNDGFVVGIRYNLGKKAANVPVWTIAGGLRVSDSTAFRLSDDGRLVLFDKSSDLVVWSSTTSNLGVQKASLLGNGNLVLLGSEDQVLWQSFSSPTSCLLPGQAFHFPQSLRAPSSNSITSYYNLVIRRSGELALVWESNVTYWRSGVVSVSSFGAVKEARFNSDGVFGVFDEKNRSIWSVTSKDFEDTSVSLSHLRIDSDGNVRIYAWDNKVKMWKVGWQAVDNQCDVFGSCGLYSLCGFNSTGPICNCLNDGSTSGNIGSDSEISGCQKLADLDNCQLRSSMIVLKHTVLYGLYPPHDSDIMLNENDCKAYCSSDASCVAVTSKNDGSGLCTVKRTSFISGYTDPSQPSISFLKVCPVPQAVSGLSAEKTNPQGNALSTPLPSGRFLSHTNGNKFVSAIALIGLATALVFIAVQVIAVWFVYQRRTSSVKSRIPFEKDALMNPLYSALIRLSFVEIKELTSHFAYQLGPTIFKGLLLNRTPIIAKVLYNVVLSEKDFRAAVSILGGTHHRNLVTLKGFCYEQKHKVLIYEYVGYGSLEKWLFERENTKEHPLQERFEIALGVARGLSYLHVECQKCIPHGNLKLENIMVDENLVPKLMDFGLQSLIQEEVPLSSETMSERDIHKFGQILLQIATCNKDPSIDADVNQLVNEIIETERLEEEEECERVERMVKIALWCVQDQPFLRPSIGEVVKVLEGSFSVDRPPSSFAFRSVQKPLEIEEDPQYE